MKEKLEKRITLTNKVILRDEINSIRCTIVEQKRERDYGKPYSSLKYSFKQ